MKKQAKNQFSLIDMEHPEKLTSLVKEPMAILVSPVKSFSSLDLWNIQRKGRVIFKRRGYITSL